jgi:hypothetical protein
LALGYLELAHVACVDSYKVEEELVAGQVHKDLQNK